MLLTGLGVYDNIINVLYIKQTQCIESGRCISKTACQRSDSRTNVLCHRKGPERGFCAQPVFFTEQMFDQCIVLSVTNLYGRHTVRNWTGVVSTDLHAYMGLLILAGKNSHEQKI